MSRNASYLPHYSTPSQEDAAKQVFGEKVRSLLNALGYSQSELARASGLRRDAISTYVRGKTWPDPKNLRKLANALGVTPNDLIPGMSEIKDLPIREQDTPFSQTRTTGHLSQPAMRMEQVRPGMFRLWLDQTLPFDTVQKILALLNEEKE